MPQRKVGAPATKDRLSERINLGSGSRLTFPYFSVHEHFLSSLTYGPGSVDDSPVGFIMVRTAAVCLKSQKFVFLGCQKLTVSSQIAMRSLAS